MQKKLKTVKLREATPDMIDVKEGFLDGKDFNQINKRLK